MLKTQFCEDANLCHEYRLRLLEAPRQSNFRVTALVFYEIDETRESLLLPTAPTMEGNKLYVVGSNDEPCHISGSICAERAALVQLRWIPNLKKINRIVICSDSPTAITPGLLCREFMASNEKIGWDMPLILGGCICRNCDLNISGVQIGNDPSKIERAQSLLRSPCSGATDATTNHDFVDKVTTLRHLYPFPSAYVRLSSADSVVIGDMFSRKSKAPICIPVQAHDGESQRGEDTFNIDSITSKLHQICSKDSWVSDKESLSHAAQLLISIASKEASYDNHKNSNLHPLSYGAAVLFSDGEVARAHQKTALEYGCTYDAVGQLCSKIFDKCIRPSITTNHEGVRPLLLVQADQFGLSHTPFAPARAYLCEHGFGQCLVAFHPLYQYENPTASKKLVDIMSDELKQHKKEDNQDGVHNRPIDDTRVCLSAKQDMLVIVKAKELAPDAPYIFTK